MELILASSSQIRLELLSRLNISPKEIYTPNIDESLGKKELPNQYALRLAKEKAASFFLRDNPSSKNSKDCILAFDTVVAVGRRVLSKASNDLDVQNCLNLLSGRSHNVYTAICIISYDKKEVTKVVKTRVCFKRLSDLDIKTYLNLKEGLGKAGGYAIQGYAESFVRRLNGSYSNVVGLPLCETRNILLGVGFKV